MMKRTENVIALMAKYDSGMLELADFVWFALCLRFVPILE